MKVIVVDHIEQTCIPGLMLQSFAMEESITVVEHPGYKDHIPFTKLPDLEPIPTELVYKEYDYKESKPHHYTKTVKTSYKKMR